MNTSYPLLKATLVIAIGVMQLASQAYANDAAIKVEDQKITLAKRPAIAFKAFPMVDPITGKSVAPNALIQVAGKSMKAEAYFSELNNYEQKLNSLGYTLRNKTDIELISKADLNMAAILDAARIQSALNLDYDSKIMQPVKAVKDFQADINSTALDWEDKVLRGFESLSSSSDPNGFQTKLTKLDEKVVKTPQLPTLPGNPHKE